MTYVNSIVQHALILIPVLMILERIIRQTDRISDQYIPLILLLFGIGGATAILGPSADSIIQGVLVTGAAVYGSQLVRQRRRPQ